VVKRTIRESEAPAELPLGFDTQATQPKGSAGASPSQQLSLKLMRMPLLPFYPCTIFSSYAANAKAVGDSSANSSASSTRSMK